MIAAAYPTPEIEPVGQSYFVNKYKDYKSKYAINYSNFLVQYLNTCKHSVCADDCKHEFNK